MIKNSEKETMINIFRKYIAMLDYFNKTLLAFSRTRGNVFIASFAVIIVALVGITSKSLRLVFLLAIKLLNTF